MKIRPVGAYKFYADRQTDMTKLTVTFRYFAKASNKQLRLFLTYSIPLWKYYTLIKIKTINHSQLVILW
jgi:hypothetical protein